MLKCLKSGRALAVLSGAALLSTAVGGGAAAEDGPYVSVGGIYVFSAKSEDTYTLNGDPITGTLELDAGFGGYIAVGHTKELTPETEGRVEFELGYFTADFDKLSFSGAVNTSDSFEGDASSLNLIVNGYLSFGVSDLVRPYVGGGIGGARTKFDTPAQTYGPNNIAFPALSGSDWEFAYQGMAGVGFAVTEQVELRVGYRYFGAGDLSSHSAEAGLIFRF